MPDEPARLATKGSINHKREQHAASIPQVRQFTVHLVGRVLADIPVEDFGIVSDILDDVVGPGVKTAKAADEVSETISVRFRTVGDISCTCPVLSTAATAEDIIKETAISEITERGATRMDDQTSEASMERRKKEGYF